MRILKSSTHRKPDGYIALANVFDTEKQVIVRAHLMFKGKRFPSRYQAKKAAQAEIDSLPF